VGLPGSGKSTCVAGKDGVLSSDEIRKLLADDPTDQSIHAQTFATLRRLLSTRLELQRPITYIDATNLTPKERRPYIRIAQKYGATIEAVFFDVSLAECQRRNRARHRVVPQDVIEKMSGRLRAPTVQEGFARVMSVSAEDNLGRRAVQPDERSSQ
jgi:predicted kinase